MSAEGNSWSDQGGRYGSRDQIWLPYNF